MWLRPSEEIVMLEKGNKGGEIGRNAKLEAEKKKEKKKNQLQWKKIGDGELASPACVLKTVFKSRT